MGQMILRWFRVDDWRSHGLAAGVAGSGVAASQIAPLSGIAAAFAAIGIGMNGIVTACIVPLLAMLWPK
jgi:putative effector of murein hydrolase